MISRRAFFDWIIGGVYAAIYVMGHAQGQPPESSRTLRGQPYRSPYQVIEDVSAAMKPGDPESVRAVVEALYKFPRVYQMPDVMAAAVKQRLIDAQRAYFDGRSAGTVDGAVVDAINALATAFDTPDWARASLLQVRFLRSSITVVMPILMRSAPSTQTDEANPPMSPLQAMWIMSLLIDQKISNKDYQAAPDEWDRDFYPRLMEEQRAREELRGRIAAGEVKAQYKASVSQSKADLLFLLPERIRQMSVADGLKLLNETFARLGIK